MNFGGPDFPDGTRWRIGSDVFRRSAPPPDYRSADGDIVDGAIFEAVVVSAELFANGSTDFGLNTRPGLEFARRDIWLRKSPGDSPNPLANRLGTGPAPRKPDQGIEVGQSDWPTLDLCTCS